MRSSAHRVHPSLRATLLGAGLVVLWLAGGCGGGAGSTCRVDRDCPEGLRCYLETCQRIGPGQCVTAADCERGQLCGGGTCRNPPGDGLMPCESDRDCSIGRCLGGVCRGEGTVGVGAECTGNADCESGLCERGRCVENEMTGPATCDDDADCPCGDCRFGECQGNRCVPAGGDCTGNADCISGLCVNGECQGGPANPMCRSDADCAVGSVCLNGLCQGFGQVPVGGECTGNADCETGLCLGGVCRNPGMGCRSDDDCAPGSTCASDGTCEGRFQVPNGGACTGNGDCRSMFCNGGTCADREAKGGSTSVGPGVPGGTPFPPPGPNNSNNVVQDPDGNIVLPDPMEAKTSSFLWVANDFVDGNEFNATVSKIDTRTGIEVARYRVGLGSVAQNRPSRTAIDLRGNAYIASRALGPNPAAGCGGFQCFADQGSVTKVANNLVDCIDKNGNGRIDTSTGPMDVYPYDPQTGVSTDECVLWSVPLGPPGAWPRALAIGLDYTPKNAVHLDGIPWVGTFYDREATEANPDGQACAHVGRAYKLDPRTGQVLKSIQVPINVYGFAVDGNGRLWATSLETGRIAGINLRTETLIASSLTDTAQCPGGSGGQVRGFIEKPVGSVEGSNCTRGYGIAVDRSGRVWVAGFDCRGVWRYTPGDADPTQGTWTERNLNTIASCRQEPCEPCANGACGNTRGVAIDGRNPASAWVAHSADPTRLTRVDVDTLEIISSRTFGAEGDEPAGAGGIGVQSDFDGKIWVVNQSSNNATGYDIDANSFIQAPINAPLVAPYTYSDFTGFALRTFTRPNGSYSQIFPGCPVPPTTWGTVTITGTEPRGTELRLRVRTADTLAGLSSATYSEAVPVEPGEPVDISDLATGGSFIQVEVLLISNDGRSTPTLSGMRVTYSCPNVCTDSSNCPGGQVCVNEACGPCRRDSQCGSGRECINGTCTLPPGGRCEPELGCKGGQVCVGRRCQPCTVSEQCAAGQVCQNGTCVAPPPGMPCLGTPDCQGGQVCVANRCVVCDDGLGYTCGAGLVCRNGSCVPPECAAASDCPQTQVCLGGYCGPCRTATDCGPGEQCANGSCVPFTPRG